MHYLLETPVIMDDSAIHDLLGNVHKTSYEDGIRETLRLMRAVQQHGS
jgi:nucleoside-diphosphate-sugar epimerase